MVRAVDRLDRFARLHFVGFTCVWPILGLVSTGAPLSVSIGLSVLAVGVCFHLFGFLLNDVVDLPIDRTQPRRAADPLVRGTVQTSTVLAVAMMQIPLAFLVTWRSGASWVAYVAIAVAFAGMAVYDLAGKRCVVPMLTDLVLGLSGSALVVFGAAMSGTVSTASVLVGVYVALYFLLFNGIHGGMRDLQNDVACGARTTGLFLGMRITDGRIKVSTRAMVFCWALQIALIVVVGLLAVSVGYDGVTTSVVLLMSAVVGIGNGSLMHIALSPDHLRWEEAYRLHLATLVLAPVLALAPTMGALLSICVIVLFLLPMAMIEHVPHIVSWLLPRHVSGA